ncbi:MAG TPA: DUF4123 domain-containing protein [Pirellulales bacterium]|nr:DUF4123 domain-containing protein [Pirellulales bacterium]
MAVRLILEIRSGSRAGQTITVRAGDSLSFGRTEKAQLIFADDAQMSGRHLAFECTGETCRVRDLGSLNGTLLNGNRVNEAILNDGDEVTAGQTRFAVLVQPDDAVAVPLSARATEPIAALMAAPLAAPIPPVLSAAAAQATPPAARAAAIGLPIVDRREVLAKKREPVEPVQVIHDPVQGTIDFHNYQPAPGHRLYAVIDGAIAIALVFQANRLGLRTQSLFVGDLAPCLANVAPYLVEAVPDSGFLDYWCDYLGKNAGILIESRAGFDEMLAHCRDLFDARDEDGNEYFFRFYDPRVLGVYLPMCSAVETRKLFGPARVLVSKPGDTAGMTRFTVKAEGPRLEMATMLQAS